MLLDTLHGMLYSVYSAQVCQQNQTSAKRECQYVYASTLPNRKNYATLGFFNSMMFLRWLRLNRSLG